MADMTRRDIAEIKGLVNELVVTIKAAEEAATRTRFTVVPTEYVTAMAGKAHTLNQRVARHRTF